MEENKINNEEIIVTEEEKVVEAPKAEECSFNMVIQAD